MRKKLQTLREGAGYTQQTFSERLGVSRSHYAQIESGDKNPSLKLSLKNQAGPRLSLRRLFLTRSDPFRVINTKR